jgi:hypothetical protein
VLVDVSDEPFDVVSTTSSFLFVFFLPQPTSIAHENAAINAPTNIFFFFIFLLLFKIRFNYNNNKK